MYFECIVGNGGVSSGIPLTVTCQSTFAGATITATDGTTTLTEQCPSTSPYTVTFDLPNTGTWTISGTVSGVTYSDSILIDPFNMNLYSVVDITVDFYSAANDTVSYTGIDAQTHTITTDSSGHATATITVNGNGSSITFTSTVAKSIDNWNTYFSKTFTLTPSSTAVYLMPNDETLYWFGYNGGIEATGSSYSTSFLTNMINLSSSGSTLVHSGVCSSSQKTVTTVHGYGDRTTSGVATGGHQARIQLASTKDSSSAISASVELSIETSGVQHSSFTYSGTGYVGATCTSYQEARIYGLWYE